MDWMDWAVHACTYVDGNRRASSTPSARSGVTLLASPLPRSDLASEDVRRRPLISQGGVLPFDLQDRSILYRRLTQNYCPDVLLPTDAHSIHSCFRQSPKRRREPWIGAAWSHVEACKFGTGDGSYSRRLARTGGLDGPFSLDPTPVLNELFNFGVLFDPRSVQSTAPRSAPARRYISSSTTYKSQQVLSPCTPGQLSFGLFTLAPKSGYSAYEPHLWFDLLSS